MGSSLAKQLRSPSDATCMGWMAQKIMKMGSGADSIDAVSLINNNMPSQPTLSPIKKNSVIVELGPGCGYGLREIISSLKPSKVYAIEISEAFRKEINADKEFSSSIEKGVLKVYGNDANKLDFIPDNCVDLIFGFNVIYFLDPLGIYLKEMHRILKPGGQVRFGVKPVAKSFDATVYVNTDWNACLDEMKSAGFVNVEQGKERLEGPLAYIPLVGKKP